MDRTEHIVGQAATFLASPVAGGIAGFVFAKETCTGIPGGQIGELTYRASELCSTSFNAEIGTGLTLVGWTIAGIWFVGEVLSGR